MADRRVLGYSGVGWWPSPTHGMVMMTIARDSWAGHDPAAPYPHSIRVRTSQIELAEALNVTTRTIRKVMNDFAAMGIMYVGNGGRTWYVPEKADDPAVLQERMMAEWPKLHPPTARRLERMPEVGIAHTTGSFERQWWEDDDPPAEATAAPGADVEDTEELPLDDPRSLGEDGLVDALRMLGASAPFSSAWVGRVMSYYDDSLWTAYRDWYSEKARAGADNIHRWGVALSELIPT